MKIDKQLEAHKGALKLSGFAEILGVCYMTAYRWARYSGLPAVKIRGSYWVDPYEAALWWREHALSVPKPPTRAGRATKAKVKRGSIPTKPPAGRREYALSVPKPPSRMKAKVERVA